MKNSRLLISLICFLAIAGSVYSQDFVPYIGTGHHSSIRQMEFSHKGRYLITLDRNGKCIIWDLLGRYEVNATSQLNFEKLVILADTVLYLPDEELFLSIPQLKRVDAIQRSSVTVSAGTYKALIHNSNLEVYKQDLLTHSISKTKYDFTDFSFNSNDSLLAHICGDEYVIIRSSGNFSFFHQINLKIPLSSIKFHPVISMLAVLGDSAGGLHVVDAERQKVLFELNTILSAPEQVYSGEDSETVMFNTRHNSTVFNLRTMEISTILFADRNNPESGRSFASYSQNGKNIDLYKWSRYRLLRYSNGKVQLRSFYPLSAVKDMLTPPIKLLWSFSEDPLSFIIGINSIPSRLKTDFKDFNFSYQQPFGLTYSMNGAAQTMHRLTKKYHAPGKGRLLFALSEKSFMGFREPSYLTLISDSGGTSYYHQPGVRDIKHLGYENFLISDKDSTIVVSVDKAVKFRATFRHRFINTNVGFSEFYADAEDTVYIYNAKTLDIRLSIVKAVKQKVVYVKTIKDVDSRQKWLVFYESGVADLFDGAQNKIASFYFFSNGEYLVLLPDNRFFASTKTQLKHVVIKDARGEIYQLDQFENIYNRPDVVIDSLNFMNLGERSRFHLAYHDFRRTFKVDLSGNISNYIPPSVDISNLSKHVTADTRDVKLDFRLNSNEVLTAFNIYVNNVPVFGSSGLDLSRFSKTHIDTSITLTLTPGINVIRPVCTDIKSVKSYSRVYYIQCNNKMQEKVYFLGIGLSTYKEMGHDLKFAGKDINDIKRSLSKFYGGKLSSEIILDESATIERIRSELLRLQSVGINDKVIIAYSGHGLLDSSKSFYLSTHKVRFTIPSSDGLRYQDLEQMLDSIPSRRKILLLDACSSGGGDTLRQMSESFSLMQDIFSGPASSSGTVVISAARANNAAIQDPELNRGNGAFSFAFIKALKRKNADLDRDGDISVSEVKLYISRKVNAITKGFQKPIARRDILDYDWKF